MPTVKSVSKLHTDYVQTVKFLRDKAGQQSDIALGVDVRNVQALPADITDPKQVRLAFPLSGIESQLADVKGDEETVGTVGDLRVIATQSDLQALCIRACVGRYTSRAQRKLNAAHRLSRHAAPAGFWVSQHTDKVQSIIQRMS